MKARGEMVFIGDGVIKRLQAEIEPEGRMAKILVEVDDPLCQKAENKTKPPYL